MSDVDFDAFGDECEVVAGLLRQRRAGERNAFLLREAVGRLGVRFGMVHGVLNADPGARVPQAVGTGDSSPKAALFAGLAHELQPYRGKKARMAEEQIERVMPELRRRADKLVLAAQEMAAVLRDGPTPAVVAEATPAKAAASSPQATTPSRAPALLVGDAAKLRTGAREMLRALAEFAPVTLTRHQAAVLGGTSPTSSTLSTYWGELKALGFIHEPTRGEWTVTKDGAAAGGKPNRAYRTIQGRADAFKTQLRDGVRRLLDVLLESPNGISREDLADRAGVSFTSSTLSTYIGELTANRLALAERGRPMRAHPWLISGAAHG